MKIANEMKPGREMRFAAPKTAWMAAAWVLAAGVGQAVAQDQRTGVAKPVPVTLPNTERTVAAPDPAPVAKPSAAVPAETVYGAYVPYRPASAESGAPAVSTQAAFNPDAGIVGDAPAERAERRPLAGAAENVAGQPDLDAGIVAHLQWLPNEIPDGAILKVRLQESISTETTKPGSAFSAEVSEDVVGDGRVYLPAGSMLKGRVTWMRAGSRISGGAAIHLEPRTVTLPDGTEYPLHARVIDTNSWQNTKVDSEGTIKRKEHTKGTLGAVGLATGGGAAAGAMIGGVPGALIGAGVGAGVGTVVWLKQDRQAVLPKDLGVVFSLTEPMAIAPGQSAAGTPGGE